MPVRLKWSLYLTPCLKFVQLNHFFCENPFINFVVKWAWWEGLGRRDMRSMIKALTFVHINRFIVPKELSRVQRDHAHWTGCPCSNICCFVVICVSILLLLQHRHKLILPALLFSAGFSPFSFWNVSIFAQISVKLLYAFHNSITTSVSSFQIV